MERRFTRCKAANAKIETRADGNGDAKTISGYAAVFYREGDPGTVYEMWPDLHERIMPGAFDRAVSEQDDVRALFNHNPDNLLGRFPSGGLRISVDNVGLRYELDVDPNDPDHARVISKLERGDLTGSSFAFEAEKAQWIEVDGVDIRLVESVKLYDVGPVTYPAYESTTAGARSDDGGEDIRHAREAWKRQKSIIDLPIPTR